MAILAATFATGNMLRGTYWLAIIEIILAVLFLVFSVMAYQHKGMYHKHPVHWLPNGDLASFESEPTHAQIDASRAKQGLPPIYSEEKQ